jgi:ubiquinone/menaquinone biosynthesis C-methylase UbiE
MISDEYKEKVKVGKSHWLDRGVNIKQFITILKDHFNNLNNLKVLDAGCAQGQDTNDINKHEINVVGLDKNESFIKQAKQNFPEISFDLGDIEKLPYKDNQFDAIFCINTLFYTNPQKSLTELERVTKKNGILFITLDKQIIDLDKNKIIHQLNIDSALNIFKNCKLLSKTYKERADDSPFKHKHFFYEIVLQKQT